MQFSGDPMQRSAIVFGKIVIKLRTPSSQSVVMNGSFTVLIMMMWSVRTSAVSLYSKTIQIITSRIEAVYIATFMFCLCYCDFYFLPMLLRLDKRGCAVLYLLFSLIREFRSIFRST